MLSGEAFVQVPLLHIQVILWEDIFVVVDDGRGQASDYDRLRTMVGAQSLRHRGGLGCLALITPNAKPPSDEARASLNKTLESVTLRCICWCVEGSGFQAAMVRGVLQGLRFFGRHTYPTHISTDIEEAITWMLPHLERRSARRESAAMAAATIREERERLRFARPF